MNHIGDEQLLLFHYAELDAATMEKVRQAMVDDAALAARYAELAAMLDAVPEPDIERDEFYGRRVWAAIEPQMEKTHTGGGGAGGAWWRMAGLAAAFALVAVTAYHFGQVTAPLQPVMTGMPDNSSQADNGTARDGKTRVINASLRQHIDSASRLFLEIENAEDMPVVDVEAEKNWAMTLLVANRLYRFAAEQAGQRRVAQVLTDMEPMLIELANSDSTMTDEEFRRLRQRLVNNNLVFKATATSRSLEDKLAGDSI